MLQNECFNKNICVIGLGKSGLSAIKLALKNKANIYVFDDDKKKIERFKALNFFLKNKINILNKKNVKSLLKMDIIILSPSVKLKEKLCEKLKFLGVEIISELEFASRFCLAPIFAVTGTNGKTTTCTLLYNILSSLERNAYLLGNIGTPLSKDVLNITSNSNVVIEASSYQLDNCKKFTPHIASILNLAPDHLKYHKSLRSYYCAKLKIFQNMSKSDFAVINYDDKNLVELTKNITPQIYYFSLNTKVLGCYIENEVIKFSNGKISFDIMHISEIKLLGKHNLSNILCAVCMALLGGVSRELIAETISHFTSIPHRIEFVKIKDKITYINDSKATNVASTISALDALKNEKLVLLLGGSDKGEKFDKLFSNHYPCISQIVCFGKTKNKLSKCAKKYGYAPKVCNDLKSATIIAHSIAQKGEIILLSPACASFDEFHNFEERGRAFCTYIE